MTLFDDPNRFCPHAKRVDFGERDKAGLIRIITRLGFARIPPRKIIMQAVMKPFEIRIKGRYFREELRRDSGFFGKFPQAGLGFRSPLSIRPPGMDHSPLRGAVPRWMSKTSSPRRQTTPTQFVRSDFINFP